MSEFDKIIGYDSIKEELKQLCDMIHNIKLYEKLGAKMPHGLLFYGNPGVGKSLMASTFIKESGRKSYIIRRNKPNGDFINEIKNIFTEAAQNTPSLIFLDDMDKFAVEYQNEAEYVTIQACIDEVSSSDVYIVATANDLDCIPESLLRAGRFDRKIHVKVPKGDDSAKIIKHYISSKVDMAEENENDIVKMLYGKSCAELKTILNEAAIYAGFERCETISMDHMVRSVLRNYYGASDVFYEADIFQLEKIAYHEAGHVVISEVIDPNSIAIASICTHGNGRQRGFVGRCAECKNATHHVLRSLAGKAATELKYGIVCEGSSGDLNKAIQQITELTMHNGVCGIGVLDIFDYGEPSSTLRAKQEAIIHAEIERYFMCAKEILTRNRDFLDAMAAALLKKETLLNSDIRKIRESYASINTITPNDVMQNAANY